jgi:small neutral amino acid transporter SnatA (MarC family)
VTIVLSFYNDTYKLRIWLNTILLLILLIFVAIAIGTLVLARLGIHIDPVTSFEIGSGIFILILLISLFQYLRDARRARVENARIRWIPLE